MAGPSSKVSAGGWTIAGAEELILSLPGVVSVRVVAKPGGEVEEVHVLTTEEVSAKQTVRNIESALLARFHLTIDHRKVSVAQTAGHKKEEPRQPARPPVQAVPKRSSTPTPSPAFVGAEPRILFAGLQAESRRSQQISFRVELDWRGARFKGEATGADVARARLETVTTATLRAIEAAITDDVAGELVLGLDGVKTVDAFERRYALVAVHALAGGQVTALTGSALIEESADKALILATLQATDRWVRGLTR
jgi:hypothetical protein